MKLYDYFRSTACYRVRIALNYKNISYKTLTVHLTNNGGEQHRPEYLALNPQGLVPTLDDNGHLLSQSVAIMEYLEETYPRPAILPSTSLGRALVRSITMAIACDIHPLNNLRVLQQVRQQFKADDAQMNEWYHHWLRIGFDSIEEQLTRLPRKQAVCYGSDITMADMCLIPQVFNAKRFNFSISGYPLINEINEHCLSIDAFAQATPIMSVQPNTQNNT